MGSSGDPVRQGASRRGWYLDQRVVFGLVAAGLTAAGTTELSDSEAIGALEREQQAALRFDPQVLAAARDIVDSSSG